MESVAFPEYIPRTAERFPVRKPFPAEGCHLQSETELAGGSPGKCQEQRLDKQDDKVCYQQAADRTQDQKGDRCIQRVAVADIDADHKSQKGAPEQAVQRKVDLPG